MSKDAHIVAITTSTYCVWEVYKHIKKMAVLRTANPPGKCKMAIENKKCWLYKWINPYPHVTAKKEKNVMSITP